MAFEMDFYDRSFQTADIGQVNDFFYDSSTNTLGQKLKVCIACCTCPSASKNVIHEISDSLSVVAEVQPVILSVTAGDLDGIKVVNVPQGTKLSKLRRLVGIIDSDLVCICDPDLKINKEACRRIYEQAAAEIHCGNDVVAYGLIEGEEDGTLISNLVSLDKWVSHRFLRRILWGCGAGITLPGQFLIVSTELLGKLDPNVDSYLDDLYLGWVSRKSGAKVLRVPVVVGKEEPRMKWSSLLSQRLRWMKGFTSLFCHLSTNISAVQLLAIHFFTYHVLPIIWFFFMILFTVLSPIGSIAVFIFSVFLLSQLSGNSIWTAFSYVIIFPCLHFFVILFWWIPASRSFLSKR